MVSSSSAVVRIVIVYTGRLISIKGENLQDFYPGVLVVWNRVFMSLQHHMLHYNNQGEVAKRQCYPSV